MTIRTYEKIPRRIQAIVFSKENLDEAKDFVGNAFGRHPMHSDKFFIRTLEGHMRVREGDFIIKGVTGEFYPCEPSIFNLTYKEVD